jgi:hypothetical protein
MIAGHRLLVSAAKAEAAFQSGIWGVNGAMKMHDMNLMN